MKAIHAHKCPLCETPAQFQFQDYENKKHFRCSTCKEYVVSVRAEIRLASSPQQWRQGLSKLAQTAPEEKILVITMPPVHRQGNEAIHHEYLPREEQIK